MRVAVIDCGTNTIRLLIAEPGPAESGLRTLRRDLAYVRLGQGVDAARRFHPDALARTFAALDGYAAQIAAAKVAKVRFLATSAARDVSNREDFSAGVQSRLGLEPEVISGAEEARLSFLGALAGGPAGPGRILVSDIGGGSTELVTGDRSGAVEQACSLDIGSVRLRERFLAGDPPTAAETKAAQAYAASLIDASGIFAAGPIDHCIGVGGTATSVAAMAAGLTVYDPAVVHRSTVALADLAALSERLLEMSTAETMRLYPILQPLRAEVIGAGALIALEITRRAGRPLEACETDILDGAALGLLQDASP
ncbi:MAG: exopolyphosphatase [Propionibacteriaceae bacterium]|jgi:exopolyphosphatase/guanosine-5'-triphosphate,3'-diphosphate pyrophosphatase|nr:exopolyphosphatase [Propionibacteriaceae bacterium]